jgi:hypothetical protein
VLFASLQSRFTLEIAGNRHDGYRVLGYYSNNALF